jgi:hypothetical protein
MFFPIKINKVSKLIPTYPEEKQDSLGLGQIPLATGWTQGWTHHHGLHTKTAKEQSRTNEEEPLFLEVCECESDVWSRPLSCVQAFGCIPARLCCEANVNSTQVLFLLISSHFYFYRCRSALQCSGIPIAGLPKQSLNCHWRLL